MTASQLNPSFECGEGMKVKVVKWCWKKWNWPILMHIYDKQTAGQFGAQFVHEISPWCGVVVNWVLLLELEILFLIKPNDAWQHLLSFWFLDNQNIDRFNLFLNRLIPPNPIPNSNAWVHHHPWWSFCQFQVWFDPIWCPISKYEQNPLIIFLICEPSHWTQSNS